MNLPTLRRVTSVTEADIAATEADGLLHMIGVGLDCTAGIFGSRIPFITISTRTALRILEAQEKGNVLVFAPAWALDLGRLLEWIDPGHLQAAMVADFARCVQSQRRIGGVQ